MSIAIEIEPPEEMASFQLPAGVDRRLRQLLDQQDEGVPLTDEESAEAEGLVDLSEMLSLLRIRARRKV